MLQDGILEWRCQYENPLFGAGGGAPQHQPVIADKIACIGRQSARQIAAWGNAGKVEVTGMPRLDFISRSAIAPVARPGRRVLVMTAKNPGFTAEQREVTLRSLRDVKEHLENMAGIEAHWRVSKAIAEELGIINKMNRVCGSELLAVLETVDAVISTPSTAILEAMLARRPVAALDYHNVPRFVPTAWTISAPQHIGQVMDELLRPTANKLAFQQDCLRDALECDGQAARRVATLMAAMVDASREVRAGRLRALSANLLGREISFAHANGSPSLAALYANQPVFQENNLEMLQVRLARAENENARLKAEIAEMRRRAQFGAWIKQGLRQLTQAGR